VEGDQVGGTPGSPRVAMCVLALILGEETVTLAVQFYNYVLAAHDLLTVTGQRSVKYPDRVINLGPR
jgi:hypothetical protein